MDKQIILKNFQQLTFVCFMDKLGDGNCTNYYFCKLPNGEFIQICENLHQAVSWGIKPTYILLEKNLDLTCGIYKDKSGYASYDIEYLDSNGVHTYPNKVKDYILFEKAKATRIPEYPKNNRPIGDIRMFLMTGEC